MNIVIVGAGDLGIHLATIFSQIHYGIVLIDVDPFKLEKASRDLDVATRLGNGTDWELLEDLMELSPDLFISLTNHDETNLAACTIAKNLGYPQTVARVRSNKYFLESRLSFERLFCVDYLISPEKLTAAALANTVLIPGSIMTETFAHGSILMQTAKVPKHWRKEDIPLSDREKLELPEQVTIGSILRQVTQESKGKTISKPLPLIFANEREKIQPNDEVTFIGESNSIRELHKFFGIAPKIPKSVMIVGGSLIGINLAKILQEHKIHIRILEKDFQKCCLLSELLPYCTIIHRDGTDYKFLQSEIYNLFHRDGTDYKFLQSEKVESVGHFIACTRDDEVNFLAGAVAHDLGCENISISLSDISYHPLVKQLGISAAASPRIHSANKILSIAREKRIASMVSIYNNQADIMEVKVSANSKIAGIPIRQLKPHLPKDLLILMIQSRSQIFIAESNRILSPGDTAIVICKPEHIGDIKKLF